MACKNSTCIYHDAASQNGCQNFPGESWANCRGASVRAVVTKPTTTQKSKGK